MKLDSRATRPDNPAIQWENRIRCAVGQPGDPRVPSLEELVRILDDNAPKEIDVDTSDL